MSHPSNNVQAHKQGASKSSGTISDHLCKDQATKETASNIATHVVSACSVSSTTSQHLASSLDFQSEVISNSQTRRLMEHKN